MMSSSAFTAAAIGERLQVALEEATRHLECGCSIKCSLAILPDIALQGMAHSWGIVDLIEHSQGSTYELAVGLGKDVLREALADFLREQQNSDRREEALPLIAPVVHNLPRFSVVLLLLIMPAHSSLWSARRRWIETCTANGEDHSRSFLFQEVLVTSLLLNFYYKVQEVWVHRWWVVERLLSHPGINLEVSNDHDRGVLMEAADKHPMNYNAWNYRRQVFENILNITQNASRCRSCASTPSLLQQEVEIALRFFETHNGDTSAASYLIFLLHKAETIRSDSAEGKYNQDSGVCAGSLVHSVWKRLMLASTQELRRHWDKGHEAVWVLRLALIHWALCIRPMCGWSLEDEMHLISVYMELPTLHDEWVGLSEVTWVAASGSPSWTSFYAARYGVQLLKLVTNACRGKGRKVIDSDGHK
ncbi:hypothetical protein, conserved [Trypanosoma brucei gambiense DAL972]|uniref:Protein farnesyltransferase alpha subunit,putative n=1 Tax=Trypanosoma brucei gambiense (strain MHOM/CI/86/DAL972) TaxID=679716 RepID=C9ZWB1_TRYB9|nr:hypothetical protein, conserved [Trypanosoma brucei gambiense DAL972]CBH13700.1 hypothetical protein, conserved [Trypanosoma brucei gambiense DAL972]|eukprot:XP_011775976.1 hypothetical protein, conserved [Trypanosoma brucei gambiense DAL972]